MQPAVQEAIEPWLVPIREGAPCGEDARYSPRFEAIQTELAKLEDPASGQADWKRIVDLCDEALRLESKELAASTYLAFGWTQVKGLDGLAPALLLVAELMSRYWDQLFPDPSRQRARVNAITWFVGRLELWLAAASSTNGVKESHRTSLSDAEEAVRRFADTVRERLGDKAPALRPLQDALKQLKQSLGEAPKPGSKDVATIEAKAEQKPAEAQTSESPTGGDVQTPTESESKVARSATVSLEATQLSAASVGAIDQFLRQTSRTLLPALGTLRAEAPHDEKLVRLWMNALYLPMQQLPERSPPHGNKTIIPPPLGQLLIDAEATVSKPSPMALEQAFWALEKHRFALDLHHVLSRLLAALGPQYSGAHETHTRELSAFLTRLPEIAELEFSDGTPFASNTTRAWLHEKVSSSTGDGTKVSASQASTRHQETVENARTIARRGEIKQALELLMATRSGLRGGRERFEITLAAAEICQEVKAFHIAAPLYAELGDQMREQHLEQWEPELASRAMLGWYRCLNNLNALAGKKDARSGATKNGLFSEEESVYVRLCQLDPVLALRERPNP